jgi:hypothetical protein
MAKKRGTPAKLKLTDIEKGILLDLIQEKKSNAAIAHAMGRSPLTTRNNLLFIKECVDHILKADQPVATMFSTTFTEMSDYKSVVDTIAPDCHSENEVEDRLIGSLAKLKRSGQTEVSEDVLITLCRNYQDNRPDLFGSKAKPGVAIMTQAASEVGDNVKRSPRTYSDSIKRIIRKPQ